MNFPFSTTSIARYFILNHLISFFTPIDRINLNTSYSISRTSSQTQLKQNDIKTQDFIMSFVHIMMITAKGNTN